MAELLGTFEQIVLLAVLSLEEEAYGRAVLRDVQENSPKARTQRWSGWRRKNCWPRGWSAERPRVVVFPGASTG